MARRETPRPLLIVTYLLSFLVVALIITLIRVLDEVQDLRSALAPEESKEIPVGDDLFKGVLALVIDDFGYRQDEVSNGFLELDAHLTFSVIPGYTYSQSFARMAQTAGFEVIVHMPMESHASTTAEEPFELTTNMTSAEIERRVEDVFNYIPEAVGMNNHQGSKVTENKRVMQVVGSTLKRLKKYFVDSRTTRLTIAEETMRRLGVPTDRRLVFLDNEFDPNLIQEQLDQLVALARESGKAIGIGHAKPNTLKVLRERIPELKASGYSFQFVSEILDIRQETLEPDLNPS